MRKRHIKAGRTEKIALGVCFAIFFAYAVTLCYPFFWMFISSGKQDIEFVKDKLSFPEKYNWGIFIEAVSQFRLDVGSGEDTRAVNMLTMFLSSAYVTLILSVLEVFVSACTAYVVCYYVFPGRKFVYGIVIFTMVVPLVGTLPASYDFFAKTKLLNTVPGLILLCVNGLSFAFLILYGGYQNLSWTYAEAAFIDGAGPFRTFFKVMLPLMKPALVSIAVVTAIGFWNDYTTPAIYYPDHPTIAYGINELMKIVRQGGLDGVTNKGRYPLMYASIIMTTIPIVIFFACFQKTIMKNMVAGGLKG